jgi:hypothetical protein
MVWDLGLRFWDLWFRVQGLGFRYYIRVLRVLTIIIGVRVSPPEAYSRHTRHGMLEIFGVGVYGFGSRVSGPGFMVSGLRVHTTASAWAQ